MWLASQPFPVLEPESISDLCPEGPASQPSPGQGQRSLPSGPFLPGLYAFSTAALPRCCTTLQVARPISSLPTGQPTPKLQSFPVQPGQSVSDQPDAEPSQVPFPSLPSPVLPFPQAASFRPCHCQGPVLFFSAVALQGRAARQSLPFTAHPANVKTRPTAPSATLQGFWFGRASPGQSVPGQYIPCPVSSSLVSWVMQLPG